jgi:hypothetical protein
MWVPCHHGMARPRVADGDGLQMWRLVANTMNKQSRTADRGWSSVNTIMNLRVPHKVGNFLTS